MVFCVNPIACRHLLEEFDKCVNIDKFQESNLGHPECSVCKDKTENWICLECGTISCSRHVNGHASVHYEETKHPISASFSDHSFWCYTCDTYVYDKCLYDIIDILDTVKFFTQKEKKEKEEEEDNKDGDAENEEKEKPSTTSTTTTSTTITTTTTTTTATTTEDDLKEIETNVEKLIISSDEEEEQTEPSFFQKVLGVIWKDAAVPVKSPLSDLSVTGIADYIKSGKAKNIVVMSGAGISVAAGIPDFRSPKTGLYSNLAKYNLPYAEAIFDIDYFKENPKPFFVLAKELYPGSFNPTPVHHFVKLLSDKGLLLRNFTQNIDTLERVAGVPADLLVEAHGSFAQGHCIKCKEEHTQEFVRTEVFADRIPKCTKCETGIVKPDIVFFGEALPSRFNECATSDFEKCDLLIVIGTSLKVYPFASLVSMAKNIPRLLINNEVVGENAYGGFKFGKDNRLDTKWIGDCQEGIKELVNLLGWNEDFEKLTNNSSKI